MRLLSEALAIVPGDIVSFVGAGGKTSSMMRLAAELSAQGRRVVVTTTTHIREPYLNEVRVVLVEPDPCRLLARLPDLMGQHNVVAVAAGLTAPSPADGRRKLRGIPPELVGRLAALPGVDHVLVEADGANGRSLKAPAAHEPVVPKSTTLLAPVAAVDVIGAPLTGDVVHRPELVALVTGIEAGAPLTAQAVATVLAHPCGGLKSKPPGARVVPIVNKVAMPADWERGFSIAFRLVESSGLERVVVGAVADQTQDLQVISRRADRGAGGRPRVAAIILAAGAAVRFGGCKQLAPLSGRPMVAHVAETVGASSADEVVVVLGSRAQEVSEALQGQGVRVVLNDEWAEGMGSSVRRGLAAVAPLVDAALFVLADQPLVTAADIDTILAHYRESARWPDNAKRPSIVVPVFGTRRGNPAVFDRAMFAELLEVAGDEGGRVVVRRHPDAILEVTMPTDGVLCDIDTPEQLRAASRSHQTGAGKVGSSSDG